jgi:hypothetical protein
MYRHLFALNAVKKIFSREAAENIRKLLNGSSHPDHAIKLDVFSYAMPSTT